MNDVRSARMGTGSYDSNGTVLTLFSDPIFQELWSNQLEVVPVGPAIDSPSAENVVASSVSTGDLPGPCLLSGGRPERLPSR